MLPHLIAWQRKHGYPLQFACEATLNLAKQPEILALMREAQFLTVFVGIETPDADALKAMRKEHNATLPMMEAINTLNSYGLEVTSDIILGLNTDTADSESQLKFSSMFRDPDPHHQFAAGAAADTVVGSPEARWPPDRRRQRARKQRALRPYDEVVATWRRCIAHAYEPERLFARSCPSGRRHFRQPHDRPGARQAHHPQSARRAGAGVQHRASRRNIVGLPPAVLARRAPRAPPGQIDAVLGIGFVAYHLIEFSREALRGDQNASFYSTHRREPAGVEAAAQVGVNS